MRRRGHDGHLWHGLWRGGGRELQPHVGLFAEREMGEGWSEVEREDMEANVRSEGMGRAGLRECCCALWSIKAHSTPIPPLRKLKTCGMIRHNMCLCSGDIQETCNGKTPITDAHIDIK